MKKYKRSAVLALAFLLASLSLCATPTEAKIKVGDSSYSTFKSKSINAKTSLKSGNKNKNSDDSYWKDSIINVKKTGTKLSITAPKEYVNWDGVSNVAQFKDADGKYSYAYDGKGRITIVKSNGKTLVLKKTHPLFGDVLMDTDGSYYVITGEANTGSNTSKETIFVSRYDANGNLIKTIGDNGSSSLADYYDDSFNTKTPFEGGNCDAAISGGYLAVNYGRHMYNGHQSNSVWIIDLSSMQTIDAISQYDNIYNSHSFGQRAVDFGDNGSFLFVSEGDCYNRAFTLSHLDIENNQHTDADIFHFWVKKGTLDSYNMYILNDNFAHIGDINDLRNGTASFVSTSVHSLSKAAAKENEQLFIQIFDPQAVRTGTSSGYVTSSSRSGLSGPNGNETVSDYGIKWLTNYSDKTIIHPQAVTDGNGNTIILYELYDKTKGYKGVYSMTVNEKGDVIKKATRLASNAMLNPCRAPIYADGAVWWTGNRYGDSKHNVYVFKY